MLEQRLNKSQAESEEVARRGRGPGTKGDLGKETVNIYEINNYPEYFAYLVIISVWRKM